MAKSVTLWSCWAALAAGLALWLGSAAPAAAEGFFFFFNQPYHSYSNPELARPAKPHRKRPHAPRREHDAKHARPPAVGPFQVIVEIASQQIAIYGQNGFIARAPISTGMPGHPTPLGVFTVLSKAKWHQSNIYSGAPMPYMQRITWSGIAMHAGPRPGYPASHGCIRLPEQFAIWLFHTTKVGARVIVTREPAAPVEIAHPKLFVPEQPVARAEPACEPTKLAAAATAEASDATPPTAKPARTAADLGVRQPQTGPRLCAPGWQAAVRHAGDHRRGGAPARHPCVHCHGLAGRRQGDALDGGVDPERLPARPPRRQAQ